MPRKAGGAMTTPSELAAAVERIWSRHSKGYGFLAARRGELWIERGFPVTGRGVEEFFERYRYRLWDLYYCPNSFKRARRLGMYAYETPFAHVDIDTGDPTVFDPPPTILTETSPSRFQGIWEFATAVEATKAEAVSRHLTRTYGGDPGGWSATKMLRIADSFNHKPAYDLPEISIVRDTGTPIEAWPDAVERKDTTGDRSGPVSSRPGCVLVTTDYDAALERFRRLLRALPAQKQMWLRNHVLEKRDQPKGGRNRTLFIMALRLSDLGMTREEAFVLMWPSGWNKFRADKRRDGEDLLWDEINAAYGLV
jgi:RepB DNA-primase from phage plasmid